MPTVLDLPFLTGADMEPSSLGRRLRELRVAAGLSQGALSKASGCGQANISRWESGVSEPLAGQVVKLAAALGVDPGDLFKPASSVPAPPKRGRPPKEQKPKGQPRRKGQ